jgi:hypothetical protein
LPEVNGTFFARFAAGFSGAQEELESAIDIFDI